MKNLIVAALLGNLSGSEAIKLANNKQTLHLQKINILAQVTTPEELGIPGLSPEAIKATDGGVAADAIAKAEGKDAAPAEPLEGDVKNKAEADASKDLEAQDKKVSDAKTDLTEG